MTGLSSQAIAQAEEEPRDRRRWAILAVLCLSLVIVSLSNTSLNVALPTMARSLRATPSDLQWVVAAYSMIFAGCLLTGGALGDRYGHRRMLNLGLVLFALASVVGALSRSIGQVIFARGLMGVGAALVMPATLAILAHVFPPDERGRAIAIWAGMAGVGGITGMVFTGWLLEKHWWGSIFVMNVVAAAVALGGGVILGRTATNTHRVRLDPVGVVLSSTGLATLVYAAISAPTAGWLSPRTLGAGVAAASLLAAFVFWEKHRDSPMLDLTYFRNRAFSAAAVTITLIFFVMYGTVFMVIQYLQLVVQYSPLKAAVSLLPLPLSFMATAPLSARFVARWGHRRVVCIGMCLLATGAALISLSSVRADEVVIAVGLAVMAAGMGLTTAPSTTAIMRALPLRRAGVGSAVNDATRELGGAIGVAVLGSILVAVYRGSAPHIGRVLSSSLAASLAPAAHLSAAVQMKSRAAFVTAFDVTMLVAAMAVALGACAVFVLLRRANSPRSHLLDLSGDIVAAEIFVGSNGKEVTILTPDDDAVVRALLDSAGLIVSDDELAELTRSYETIRAQADALYRDDLSSEIPALRFDPVLGN